MSSDAESISSGMTLPAWMRSRIEKNDFDGIPFSPPSHDESFFYIRYPVNSTTSSSSSTGASGTTTTSSFDNDTRNNSGIRHLTDLFSNNNINNDNGKGLRSVDFSKHTEPCKKFLKDSPNTPGDTVKNPPKSFGTDDGFKGPGAACGSSIVKVAQQMVSSRSLTSTRGFKVVNLDQQESTTDSDNAFHSKTIEDQQIQSSGLIKPQTTKLFDDNITGSNNSQQQQKQQELVDQQQQQKHQQQLEHQQMTQSSRLMYRRGSKSLPSSPLSSPKSMRKYNPNPYFTTTSLFSSNNSSTDGRGWFLSSLLGFQRDTTSSTSSISHIEEESDDLTAKIQQNNISSSNTKSSSSSEHQKILRAKPSELREMNFWSPTSM